ncbi:MAG: nucleotidyltransferase substrate binding protein [Deltaproteobacteria bacterium]|jgi:nucleotidyltransferase substrate binding protein (TIGR01987 family)|nr:nucleotidyltransferase substrate binding protein [Deltaproteobacteria bacterium]
MNRQDNTPRWLYRFNNYKRAFGLLREAMESEKALTQLEKEGCIQRFEYAFELAWKVMKDYLESEGLVIAPLTPANVIRMAFEARIIADGQVWMDALDARNKMSHTYDLTMFENTIADIRSSYLAVMEGAYMFFLEKAAEHEL